MVIYPHIVCLRSEGTTARDKRDVDVFSDFMLLFVSKLCVRWQSASLICQFCGLRSFRIPVQSLKIPAPALSYSCLSCSNVNTKRIMQKNKLQREKWKPKQNISLKHHSRNRNIINAANQKDVETTALFWDSKEIIQENSFLSDIR